MTTFLDLLCVALFVIAMPAVDYFTDRPVSRPCFAGEFKLIRQMRGMAESNPA